jgi:hypothetical protein
MDDASAGAAGDVQHGDRRVSRVENGRKTTVDRYMGKQLNS